MPKWSDIRALQFLDIYEKHECLWNPRIEEYKNKSARNAAFDAMLAELQIPDLTANDIKLKIKSIRTTYKRELSTVLKAEANRTKDGPVYKPKLFWFHRADSFLRPVSTSRFSCCPSVSIGWSHSILNAAIFSMFATSRFKTKTRAMITAANNIQSQRQSIASARTRLHYVINTNRRHFKK